MGRANVATHSPHYKKQKADNLSFSHRQPWAATGTKVNELQQIQDRCQAQFNPGAATFSGTLSLNWTGPDTKRESNVTTNHSLALAVSPGELHWLEQRAGTQAAFYFSSIDRLERLLFSSPDPLQELLTQFMSGDIRSSGYLLWTFPLLSLFRGVR